MGIFEIISAIVLIIACVLIVAVVLMQDTKTQMSKSISGTSSTDNFFSKNAGRTKEAMLTKLTTVAAFVFFVLALAVNIINVYFGASSNNVTTSDTSSVVSDVLDIETESEAADDTTSAAEVTSDDTAADDTTSVESEAPAEESTATE